MGGALQSPGMGRERQEGISVTVWSLDGDFSSMGFIVDQIDALISEWYPGEFPFCLCGHICRGDHGEERLMKKSVPFFSQKFREDSSYTRFSKMLIGDFRPCWASSVPCEKRRSKSMNVDMDTKHTSD